MMTLILMVMTGSVLAPADIEDIEKVTAVCRVAHLASAHGSPKDSLRILTEAARDLPSEQRYSLIRMCALYSAGIRDQAQQQLDDAVEKLETNSEELRKLLGEQRRP
jgi:hypothetical protein